MRQRTTAHGMQEREPERRLLNLYHALSPQEGMPPSETPSGNAYRARDAVIHWIRRALESNLNVEADSRPDAQVNADVVVDQNVAHPADRLPVQLSETAPRLGRDPLGGFVNYFDITDDRVLKLFRCHERLFARADKAHCAVAPL